MSLGWLTGFLDGFRKRFCSPRFDIASGFKEANRLMVTGDRHAAILIFRQLIEADPGNVAALSDLSALLSDTGQNVEARRLFELACALDDTFVPVILNHAKLLTDERRSAEAMPLLLRAKAFDPFYAYTDSVYQSRLFQFGHTDSARAYQLKSWLAAFDRLRMANGQLFSSSYADIDEAAIAAEHRFWAETLYAPLKQLQSKEPFTGLPKRRIRIGYLSPDFRNHAVRYFFRPLLENHDKTRFEVFLFHDFGPRDWQTDLIEAKAEHFVNVSAMSDVVLADHLKNVQLDILVDLCGHTSYNRIDLFQNRLAKVQINALGYPPTSGLSTMDYKLLDAHVVVPEHTRYYTERPLVLPTSFWCFDPLEDEAPIAPTPPSASGLPVVFGCFGNICKITDRMLHAWQQVLNGVPGSTLRIRSVNFQDDAVIYDFRQRLQTAGLESGRVELEKPMAGIEFFASYNDVDIILDTYPFCGGTTTSFAVYMGVPVVTLAGRSLVSRMGLSIMRNAGGEAWVAEDFDGYVERAIRLAQDKVSLLTFKREARAKMKACSLGNGALFAKEFESACEDALLAQTSDMETAKKHEVPLLEAQEIHRRAYQILVNGQPEAARRVLHHGISHYPNHSGLQSLWTQLIADSDGPLAAVDYLEQRLHTFLPTDLRGPLMLLTGLCVQLRDEERARTWLQKLRNCDLSDAFDEAQFALYQARLEPPAVTLESTIKTFDCGVPKIEPSRLCVLVCGTPTQSAELQAKLSTLISHDPTTSSVLPELVWRHTTVDGRMQAFEAAAKGDFHGIVLVHAHVDCINPHWSLDISRGLQEADIVGFLGARSARKLEWRTASFELKAGAWMQSGQSGIYPLELHWYGAPGSRMTEGMQILDGGFIACKTRMALTVAMDEELLGEQTLLEEDWVLRAAQTGARVVVDQALGIVLHNMSELDRSNRAEARLHFVKKHRIDVFEPLTDDHVVAMVPVNNSLQGLRIASALCQPINDFS